MKKAHLSRETKVRLAKDICRLYEQGTYTIASCCEAAGIKYTTFQQWAQVNLSYDDIKSGKARRGFVHEVHAIYKRALELNKVNYNDLLIDAVRHGLLLRARGLEYTESHSTERYDKYGNFKGAYISKIEKIVLPDSQVLIFIAKYLDPYFRVGDHREAKEISLNPYESMSLEEIRAETIRLEKMLLSDSDV